MRSDHFDQDVEASLRRDLPIISTPHAKSHLSNKSDGEAFTQVHDLDTFDEMFVDIEGVEARQPAIKVAAMPGKHVPTGVIGKANDFVGAVSNFVEWAMLG